MASRVRAAAIRVKCVLFGHEWRWDRAEDLDPGAANRYHRDGSVEDIDGCYVIDKCDRCGEEKRIASPVSVVEDVDIPKSWEDDDAE